MSQGITDNIRRLFYLLIIVVVILALVGASEGQINFVVNVFASAILGAVTSLIAASIIEAFTGDALKFVLMTVEIRGFEFSVSLFFVATVILKLLIFR